MEMLSVTVAFTHDVLICEILRTTFIMSAIVRHAGCSGMLGRVGDQVG